jgi:hypothetical protein
MAGMRGVRRALAVAASALLLIGFTGAAKACASTRPRSAGSPASCDLLQPGPVAGGLRGSTAAGSGHRRPWTDRRAVGGRGAGHGSGEGPGRRRSPVTAPDRLGPGDRLGQSPCQRPHPAARIAVHPDDTSQAGTAGMPRPEVNTATKVVILTPYPAFPNLRSVPLGQPAGGHCPVSSADRDGLAMTDCARNEAPRTRRILVDHPCDMRSRNS